MQDIDVDPHDEPFFSSEAQETFSVGDRVYRPQTSDPEGVYLGYDFVNRTEVAVVEWDEGHAVCHESFADIRNLYR